MGLLFLKVAQDDLNLGNGTSQNHVGGHWEIFGHHVGSN